MPVLGGTYGCQFDGSMYLRPATTMITMMPTLTVTMKVLAPAEPRMPTYSSTVMAAMISTAGTLMNAPVRMMWSCTSRPSGALTSTFGRWMWASPSRLTTYADQLTATADAEIAYSSSRFQPMNQASASPMVA